MKGRHDIYVDKSWEKSGFIDIRCRGSGTDRFLYLFVLLSIILEVESLAFHFLHRTMELTKPYIFFKF